MLKRPSGRTGAWVPLLLLVAAAPAEPLEDWLHETLRPPDRGTTEWTLVLTTGHFGRDPRLAEATRRVALGALGSVGSEGDRVRVVAAEMTPWGEPRKGSIAELANLMPMAPAPGSRGGRDIEGVLAAVAPTAKGAILVLSPGASQLPMDGKGALHGGDLRLPGFDGPFRKSFLVPTADGPRTLLATLLVKPGAFSGDAPRQPLADPPPPYEEARAPEREAMARFTPPFEGFPYWCALPLVLLGGVGGYLLSRNRRSEPNVESVSVPAPAPSAPSADGVKDEDEALAVWRDEARKQQRRLDLVAQDLAAAAERFSSEGDAEKIELRQELTRREHTLRVWDETAMDYLDGIDRALAHPELSPERRQTWERAAGQFVRLAQRAGLDPIAPREGDPVVDGHHRIEAVVAASDLAAEGTVATLLAPGYRRGDHVLRQARIEMAGQNRL